MRMEANQNVEIIKKAIGQNYSVWERKSLRFTNTFEHTNASSIVSAVANTILSPRNKKTAAASASNNTATLAALTAALLPAITSQKYVEMQTMSRNASSSSPLPQREFTVDMLHNADAQ